MRVCRNLNPNRELLPSSTVLLNEHVCELSSAAALDGPQYVAVSQCTARPSSSTLQFWRDTSLSEIEQCKIPLSRMDIHDAIASTGSY
jgi:hypothetical protein